METFFTFLLYPFLFFSLYFQVFLLLSFFSGEKRIHKEKKRRLGWYPRVSIAVPCWNEERTIATTLDSLLALDYPVRKLEIIAVDDGSSDRTWDIIKTYQEKYKGIVRGIKQENGGKHVAVNNALKEATGEIFGCLDADSFVTPKALKEILTYFERNKEIMAVTPCMHIKSPNTIIQRLQAIEYLMGVFLRKTYGELNAIQVTPGPFSLFRKEVFDKIGNYRKAYNTEDFEITLRMHKHNMKIANAHKALVYTAGPSTLRGYFYQRLRWARGFLENAFDYREMFFKRRYGNFGVFTLPGAFIFVFYSLYAASFMFYHYGSSLYDFTKRYAIYGFDIDIRSFGFFYINTSLIMMISVVMFTGFLLVLYIAYQLSDDRQEFYKNFPVFFVIFPFLAPIYMTRAVLDTLLRRKNEWVLQDNKGSYKVAGNHTQSTH